MKAAAALLMAGLLLSGCMPPAAVPHYHLGSPYQRDGIWFYPHESYDLTETGLAAVFPDGHAPTTANGEAFDPAAVMAGHPTLQLPAIARLTNLETGRSLLVRINDRGSGHPGRWLDITRRTAALLGVRDAGATRIRLQILPTESRAAVDGLAGAPMLAMAAAPRTPVIEEGVSRSPASLASTPDRTPRIERLPDTVTEGSPAPGRLWVRLDSFQEYPYAAAQRAAVVGLGAGIESWREGRIRHYRTRIGPFDTVRQADDALRAALGKGIPDARIVVE